MTSRCAGVDSLELLSCPPYTHKLDNPVASPELPYGNEPKSPHGTFLDAACWSHLPIPLPDFPEFFLENHFHGPIDHFMRSIPMCKTTRLNCFCCAWLEQGRESDPKQSVHRMTEEVCLMVVVLDVKWLPQSYLCLFNSNRRCTVSW